MDEGSLLATDPPLPADDFAPAIWVPLTRALRARRRLTTMVDALPAGLWTAPSRAPAWNRRDVLAHLASSDRRYHDVLIAVLNGSPLHKWSPDPSWPSPELDRANGLGLERYSDYSAAELAAELQAGADKTVRFLAGMSEEQVLMRMGFAANGLALLEAWTNHDHRHADDIINGPTMMRDF